MGRRFRKTSYTNNEFYDGQHRFEHWYRDKRLLHHREGARRVPRICYGTSEAHLLGSFRLLHPAPRLRAVGRDGDEQSLSLRRILEERRTAWGNDAQAPRLSRMARDEADRRPPRAVLAHRGEPGLLRWVLARRVAGVARVQLHARSSGPGATGDAMDGLSAHTVLPGSGPVHRT